MDVSIFHDMTCKLPVTCLFEGGKGGSNIRQLTERCQGLDAESDTVPVESS